MKNTVVITLVALNIGLVAFSYLKQTECYDSLCKRIQNNREISLDTYNIIKRRQHNYDN